jgi:hypothetical protein
MAIQGTAKYDLDMSACFIIGVIDGDAAGATITM